MTRSPCVAELLGTAYLLLPLLGGAIFHGACMKTGWLAFLERPIDAGRQLRGRPLFGRSKTWRGPLLVAAGSAAVWALQRGALHDVEALAAIELVDYASLPWWLGGVAGAVAELFELPNSFVKRRLAIEPGGTTGGAGGVVFYLWDQLDVLMGWWVALAWLVPATPLRIAVSVVIVVALHPLLTWIGYLIGVRPTAR